ncbi:hypothetical protein F5Y02DRAFT_417754 [Annulohypoxylon stygium]|nr:hypothetical protein F5Y02DRAFT_417754 [Annulohypoxylon stygium]
MSRGEKEDETNTPKLKGKANVKYGSTYIGGTILFGESPISWRERHNQEHVVELYEESRKTSRFEPFFVRNPAEIKDHRDEPTPFPSHTSLSDDNMEVDIAVENYAATKGGWDALPKTPYASIRERKTPRFAYRVYNPERSNLELKAEQLQIKATEDIGIFARIQEVWSQCSSGAIEWLFDTGERPNYNLAAYSYGRLRFPNQRGGTIEFREAAGTADGEWAETWARICVGLTNFAIHTPVEEYLDTLYNIHRAAY